MSRFDSDGKDKPSTPSSRRKPRSSSSPNNDLKQLALSKSSLPEVTLSIRQEISSLQTRLDEQILSSHAETARLYDLVEKSEAEKKALKLELGSLQTLHQTLIKSQSDGDNAKEVLIALLKSQLTDAIYEREKV